MPKSGIVYARGGWLVPAIILVISIYFTSTNRYPEMEIAWSAFAAAISCMICISATGYRLLSLVTLVSVWHMIVYPIAATMNLLQEVPSVRPDLWLSTDLAMWGCTVGCISLAFGAAIAGRTGRDKHNAAAVDMPGRVRLTKPAANIALFAFLIPAVALRFAAGLYDERFAADVMTLAREASRYQNILSYVTRLSQVGIFLQLFRYLHTKSLRDLHILLVLSLIFIIAFLPTGNRMMAFGFVPFLFILYLNFEPRRQRAISVFLILALSFSLLSSVVQAYRETGQGGKPFSGRFETMEKIATGEEIVGDEKLSSFKTMARRLADYVSTGRIIDYSPDLVPFRGIQGLEGLWMAFIPKLIFNERATLGGASMLDVEEEYQVHTASQGGGSSPTMIIGDLYSRWGWPGVILGMGLLGMVLTWITKHFLMNWNIQTVCFYVLYVQSIPPTLTTSELFGVIVVLTRELAICWLISKALAFFLMKHLPKGSPMAYWVTVEHPSV